MAQIPIPFSSSFRSLTLNVTTGAAPNQVTHTQAITSVLQGNNSVPITDAGILTAFSSQPLGTTFIPSIVAKYGNDSNGNALTTTSTPSVASFIARVISLTNIPNRLTTDTSFSLSSLITTVSTGSLSYSSSNQAVATVNPSGLVTPVGAGTTTITVNQAATANHIAGSASATFTVTLPPPPISLAANGVTIQYTGAAGDVPNNMPRFIEANPRGTGNEWFAVVKQGMKQAVTDYAKGLSGSSSPFTPLGQSQPVPNKNIITTLITDMNHMFYSANIFNGDISSWDVSNVTNMGNMFGNANSFNQDIGSWNVSNVKNMDGMFGHANSFNKNIGSWNVSSVETMISMFSRAYNFNNGGNSSIGSWNVSNVTIMSGMFFNATSFNQNISGWNVARVGGSNYINFRTDSALTTINTPAFR
jgi:surface protein